MRLSNEREVIQFDQASEQAYMPVKYELLRRDLISMCMYEGAQWTVINDPVIGSNGQVITRLVPNMNPDVAKIRVTRNRIAKFIQMVAAATFPEQIDADVQPPDRGANQPNVYLSQVCEDGLNALVDSSRYLAAARSANFFRCITGAWGIGLTARKTDTPVVMMGQQIASGSSVIEAFDFPELNLTLDPANINPDLHRHDYVTYSDIWTADKVRRVFGIQLDESKLPTIGSLTPLQMGMSTITSRRLFSHFITYSRTKGTRVKQLHVRGDDGTFRQMFILLETSPGQVRIINADNPESPYGGDGMPLTLLTAHRRGDRAGWIGDVAMMKEDQDWANLMYTIMARQALASGSPKIMADMRSVTGMQGKTPETFSQQFTSNSGQVVFYQGSDRNQNIAPPQVISSPPPQAFYPQMIEQTELEMRNQAHISEAQQGVLKSHVPASYANRVMDAAARVHDARVKEDIDRHNQILPVLLGTGVRLAKSYSPGVIQTLTRSGFDEQDLGEFMSMDGNDLPVNIQTREASIRFRSNTERRQDLQQAVIFQSIDPAEYRTIMARDLDSPITVDDGWYNAQANRAAMRVLAGEEWQPKPLGRYAVFYIEAFRRSLAGLSKKNEQVDPDAGQRLMRAIVSQQEANAAEAMLAQGAGLAQPQAQPETSVETGPPESASLNELASQIESGAAVL